MPVYKTLIFLNYTGTIGSGWSETYWHERSTNAVAFDAALSLAQQRQKLMPQDVHIAAVRTSDAAIRGDSMVVYTPEEGWGPPPWEFCQNPWNSFLYRLQSGTMYRSMHHIRGLDDGGFGQVTEVGVLLRRACDKFVGYLAKQQFRIRSLTKGNDNPQIKIADLVFNTTTHVATLDTVGAHGLAVPNQFRISGARFVNIKGNGTFQVLTVPSATQITFGFSLAQQDASWIGLGTVQKLTIGYPIIDEGQFVRTSHKKVGRSFGVAPGRAAKRAAR